METSDSTLSEAPEDVLLKTRLRVLVVEDSEDDTQLLVLQLKRAGYEVTEASEGDQAIGQVNKYIYDLVITGVRMPKADGMEVLKAEKSSTPETVV